VAVTHLGGTKARAARVQLQALLDAYSSWPKPRILLGDLNMDPWEVASQLSRAGFSLPDDGQPSFSVVSPYRRIDHVATDGLKVERVDVRSTEVSDHRAVVATLD
jgi:endonuclease/exonuclease/phosphatase family metal-dependent hydrolase